MWCDAFWGGRKGSVVLASTLQMWYKVQTGLFPLRDPRGASSASVTCSCRQVRREIWMCGMGVSLRKFWLCIVVCSSTVLISWTCASRWRHPVCSSEQYRSQWLLCCNSGKLGYWSSGSLRQQQSGGISFKYPPLLRLVESLWDLTRLLLAVHVNFFFLGGDGLGLDEGRFCSLWKLLGILF